MAKKKSSAPKHAQLMAALSQMRVTPKPARRRQRVPRTLGMGDAASRYAHALISPFSKEAEGVRVPEPYAISTVTRKVHVPIVLTSSAGGGLDFSVQPHLINSFVQTLGTFTGGAGTFSPVNLPAGINIRSAITPGSIASLVQTYRIVAVGLRLKTNVDFTRSGGRVYGAVLPASQELPSAFNSGTSVSGALGCWEIPNDGTNISQNIINLPRGFQFTTSELMSEGGCEVMFPICSARALDFLDAQAQGAEQHMTYSNNVGVEVGAEGLGRYCAAGFSQFVMRAEGLEPSKDVFTAEVVYHVEGIPLVGAANLVESTPHTPAPATPNEIHLAHRLAAARPVVTYVSAKLRELGGGVGRGAAAARAGAGLFGAAERVLGLAVRSI